MQNSEATNDCVLVIDDDEVMRELLTLLLTSEGRAVLTAEDGEAALELLAGLPVNEFPSVVLTDLKMPGLSGAALAERLRGACPASTLLIAMSGSEPDVGVLEPFDAFLRKPFTIAEVDAVLQKARAAVAAKPVAKAGKRRERGVNLSAAADEPEIPALDETIYAKLFSTMGETQLPSLYTLLLNDVPERIARMQSAVGVNDAATFVREAHAIKGGCGMLGATEIHALADKMEAGGLVCSPLLDDFQRAFERLRRILEERMMVV